MTDVSPATNILPLRQGIQIYSPEQEIAFLRRENAATRELLQRQIDVSVQQSRTIQDLFAKAYTDTLTGLYNNAYMMEEGPRLVTEAETGDRAANGYLMVVYIDVDGLKSVNDNYGHAAGDKLLETVADSLRSKFRRQSDQILIRKSGDEFVLILKKATPEYVGKSFEAINHDTKCFFEGKRIDIRMSFGCAVYAGQDFHQMLAEADSELYQNKKANKANGLTTTVTSLTAKLPPQGPSPAP